VSTQVRYVEDIQLLEKTISLVAPLASLRIDNVRDKATWKMTFNPGVTAAEVSAAHDVIDTFDPEVAKRTLGRVGSNKETDIENLYELLLFKDILTLREAESAYPGISSVLNKRKKLKRTKV